MASTKLTPIAGPASGLIREIEAMDFRSRGVPLAKFPAWRRLKSLVIHMERAVNYCWRVVTSVREQIQQLRQKQSKASAKDVRAASTTKL